MPSLRRPASLAPRSTRSSDLGRGTRREGAHREARAALVVSLELDPTIDPDTGARIRRRRGGGTYRTRREAEEALRDALDASRRGWQGPDRVTVGGFLVEEWLPAVELRLAPTTPRYI